MRDDAIRDPGSPRGASATRALALLALGWALVALWGITELAGDVLDGETAALDRAVLEWLRARHRPWLDRAAMEVTALGSAVVICAIALATSVLLWHVGRRRRVGLIWLAISGGFVLNQTLKYLFGRARPDVFEGLVPVGPLSFPSGHAINATVFYTVLAYAIGQVIGPGIARSGTYALAALVVLAVGASRLYLGVHHPSDVLAGFAIGHVWAVSCTTLVEGWARRRAAADAGGADTHAP